MKSSEKPPRSATATQASYNRLARAGFVDPMHKSFAAAAAASGKTAAAQYSNVGSSPGSSCL